MDNTPQEAPEESPLQALDRLAQAAKLQRLAPAEEDHAVALLLPLLQSGKSGITSVLDTLVALPWIVSVNAISAAWPEWTLVMRRHLLSGLGKLQSDQALRLRLSLARAIFKIEPPAALKIAAAALPDLLDAETGTLSPKHRQIFFNVLIGKGKPWLLQLPLADFKPSEADAIVHCAVETFPFCPPLSQFSILRWVHAGGRFKKINDTDLAAITRSVGRWNGKLQRQLKAEIDDLPESLTAVFKPAPAARPEEKAPAETSLAQPEIGLQPAQPTAEPAGEPASEATAETEITVSEDSASNTPAELPATPAAPATETRSQRLKREREERRNKRDRKRAERHETQPGRSERQERQERSRPQAEENEAPEAPEDEEDLTQEVSELEALDGVTPEPAGTDDEERRPRSDSRRERDERRSEREGRSDTRDARSDRDARNERGRQKTAFDFKESLRGLDAYVTSLRTELEQAKTQLRRREEDTRRSDRGSRYRLEERIPADVEAIQKHNAQLEQTVADLRQQLEDLAAHHEAVAESRDLHGAEPLPEGSIDQLRKLLSIKLQDDFETYSAMRQEPLDRVFRLDYRDLLGQVFDVLIEQGVTLRATPTKG